MADINFIYSCFMYCRFRELNKTTVSLNGINGIIYKRSIIVNTKDKKHIKTVSPVNVKIRFLIGLVNISIHTSIHV